MRKVAIVTDTNANVSNELAESLNVTIIPMPFSIDGKECFEGRDFTREKFFEYQQGGADIFTSQPSLTTVTESWDKLLKEYDEVVHIPMSSSLSSSCSTAMMLAQEYEGKVHVVDNRRISITLKNSVIDAVNMAEKGYDGKKIKEVLEETGKDCSIYITVETLEYLKKGGRITPAAAAIGTMLKIKPVLQIQGGKIDSFAKVRTKKNAKKVMTDAVISDMKERFGSDESGKGMILQLAYTGDDKEILEFKEELKEVFPEHEILIDHLSLSITTHIGPGAIAIACTKKLEI